MSEIPVGNCGSLISYQIDNPDLQPNGPEICWRLLYGNRPVDARISVFSASIRPALRDSACDSS